MASTSTTKYDLLLITDATGSMRTYLNALHSSITEILALSRLSGVFSRIGVIAYHDYCDNKVIKKSGWNSPKIREFLDALGPWGGGDWPEAAKSALIEALKDADDSENTETLVLWYTDAPPHHPKYGGSNMYLEIQAYAPQTTDWVKLTAQAQKKRFTVFTFTPKMAGAPATFYAYLAQMTGGLSINQSGDFTSEAISQLTMDVVLSWMGQNVAVAPKSTTFIRQFARSPLQANPPPTDEDKKSQGYMPGSTLRTLVDKTFDVAHVPRGSAAFTISQTSLGKRFSDRSQTTYRAQVYESLSNIIATNIMALTRNPVFGQLWRAVCKESHNAETQALVNAFSVKVARMSNVNEKATLQKWLEDSFDATEAIMEMIERVPSGGSVVYLDFDADVDISRTDLLEVSRSCYSAVLKKIASVFTHLKIKEPGSDVVLQPNQRYLPLNFEPRDLFRTLPHLVVPGTLYPARAASVTAIIALVIGVPFLQDAAKTLLATEKGKWLNTEVPENLSFECGKLLLSAPEGTVLTEGEKAVYSAMRRYRFVELNLKSTLEAMVPWKPSKTREVGDFMRECTECHKRRSITLMSEEKPGACGLCSYETEYPEHTESESCWVECNEKSCRAQYVVEHPQNLRIRPKCHYCRNNLPCPWLECNNCTNRIVIPKSCRLEIDVSTFLCPACADPEKKRKVVVSVETTTLALNEENGLSWLGYTKPNVAKQVFQSRSAFKMFQAHGFGVFEYDLATETQEITLVLDGRTVKNGNDVRAHVERRAGRGEVELGQCSLCFDDKPRDKLFPACGRSGCSHCADEECLQTWYGKSEPGKSLNLMQLACPFCRRRPAVKILNRYNARAATLGGLREALEDRHYFYAWCLACGFAKRAQERACCGDDWTPNVQDFRCEDCRGGTGLKGDTDKVRVKACPSCGVMVEKIDGCNHIECNCGAHFCHACGGEFSANVIYQHMAEAHGGYYYNEDEDD